MFSNDTSFGSEPEIDISLSVSSADDSYCSISQPLGSLLDSSFSPFPKNFNIVHINAQSIPSHFPDLLSSFDSKYIHAILVSETFLKPCLPSTSYCLPGFHLIRNDRTGKGGGGVAIYLRSHIPFNILDKSTSMYSESSEHLFIEVLFGHIKLLLGVFYSPSLHIDYFDMFESLLEQFSANADHTIIMGDFNTCLIKNDRRAKKLINLVNSCNLNILPTNATHFFPNCAPSLLDLMIVSSPYLVDGHGQLPAEAFSYHDLVFTSYRVRPPRAKPTVVMRRSFSKFNNALFKSDASKIDWSNVLSANSIDDKLIIFNSVLTELFDVHAPLRPIKLKHLPAPWLTMDIKAVMNKRNAAKSKYKLWPLEANQAKYKRLRNHCSKVCRDAQRNFIRSSVENSDSSRVWRFLNSLGIGRQRKMVHQIPDLDLLNQHFTNASTVDGQTKLRTLRHLKSLPMPGYPPLYFNDVTTVDVRKLVLAIKSDAVGSDGISRRMINLLLDEIAPIIVHLLNYSLSTFTYPSIWQTAFVIPVPKIPNPTSHTHFRPISILPFLSKVLERIVNKQLNTFLTKNKALTCFQSGFRPGHSTVTALIKVCDDIRKGMDTKLVTALVLLDFSNAFNNVDFDLLLARLESLNISAGVVNWFRTYLFGRRQCVRFDCKSSVCLPLSAGVPQGGVLSPLLFSIFINSISSVITSSFHFYADDLQIYISETVENFSHAISTLNSDLDKISEWCQSFGLLVNPKKSQVIIIGNPKLTSRLDSMPSIRLDGVDLPLCNTVKNLGVILDRTLSWGPHVTQVARRTFATISYLRRWKNLLPMKTKISLSNTLLLPILDYADSCYPDLTKELLNKLERLQNLSIRFIFGLRKFDHISQYREQLRWLSVGQRRNMHALSLLYGILYHPHTPPYLKDRFAFLGAGSQFSLRSSSDNKLAMPFSRTKYYSNSFTVSCVILWNSLPVDIRQSKSLQIFKTRLKNYYLST